MPIQDLDADSIWHRQPEEDEQAYAAFLVFRDLSQGSTVEQACLRALGAGYDEGIAQWQSWSEEWAWEERAARYRASPEAAKAGARDLTDRWTRVKAYYDQDERPPSFLQSLFGRGKSRRSGKKRTFLQRWAEDRRARKHFAAQQSAALRSARGGKKLTLLQRWTLFVRRQTDKDNENKGIRGRIRSISRRINVLVRKHTVRFVLAFGLICMFLGSLLGMYFLRWRRLVFQNAVVFSVNEASVRRSAFQDRLEKLSGRQVMHDIIEENLRLQFAKAKKALPGEKALEARLAEDQKDPNLAKSIAAAGLTLDQYRTALRDEMAQANLMSAGQTITEAEVRKYYERNIDKKNVQARFYVPETIQVAVIGTRSRESAQAALDDLKQGVPWEEAARSYSLDVSAFQGGVLPPFARGRTMSAMIPGMDTTIFALEPGQRIGPVKFGEGWWIIQCREKAPEKILPYDRVKVRARMWALMEKGIPKNGRRIASEYAAFQKRAKVQVFDPFFRSMMAR